MLQLGLFGAGPQRTGTSWLDACLREHLSGIASMPEPAMAQERVGLSTLPASSALARLAARGAAWLRDRRLYAPLTLARRLGLKNVVFGSSAQPLPKLSSELRHKLVLEFEPDIAYVEDLLGQSLSHWRE